MRRRIEQRVDLGDRSSALDPSSTFTISSPAPTSPSFEDAEVESGPPARRQQRRHPRLVHANADAIAGDPGLRDLEQGAADPVAIADIDAVVRQAFDGEVLAELSVDKVGRVGVAPASSGRTRSGRRRPRAARLRARRDRPDRLRRGSTCRRTASVHRILPDAGVHRHSSPCDVAWETDIDGQQSRHVVSLDRAIRGTERPTSTLRPRQSPFSVSRGISLNYCAGFGTAIRRRCRSDNGAGFLEGGRSPLQPPF